MNVLIVSSPKYLNYHLAKPLVTAFQQSLLNLGYKCDVRENYVSGYDVCLVMSPEIDYNFPKDKTYKVTYNYESLRHRKCRIKINRNLKQFNCILDYNISNIQFGFPIEHLHCPIGYHPSFEMELPTIQVKKYPISLIGYVCSGDQKRDEYKGKVYRHRATIIKKIYQDLGLEVKCVRAYKDLQWSGDTLRDMIFNTDIHLNLHNTPEVMAFESDRVIRLLLCNQQFVISEKSQECPLTSGEHFVETNDIVGSIEYYLRHPEERRYIAKKGYEFIKTKYRIEECIKKCFDRIGKIRR